MKRALYVLFFDDEFHKSNYYTASGLTGFIFEFKMAAQGEGNIGGYIPPSFPQRNGYDRETPILDSGPNQSMEDMIKEATDMQSGASFDRSRLRLQTNEEVSPFHQPSKTPSPFSSSSSSYKGRFLLSNLTNIFKNLLNKLLLTVVSSTS